MSRADRNFGFGTRLNSAFSVQNLAKEATLRLGVGSATTLKMQTALRDLSAYLEEEYGCKDLASMSQDQYSSWTSSLVDRVGD